MQNKKSNDYLYILTHYYIPINNMKLKIGNMINAIICVFMYFLRVIPINPIPINTKLRINQVNPTAKFNLPLPELMSFIKDILIKNIIKMANNTFTMLTITIFSFSSIFLSCCEILFLFINQSFFGGFF